MEPSTAEMAETTDAVALALARATLYSALALGFRSPTEETIARLGSQDAAATLARAAVLLDPTREFGLAAISSLLTPNSSLLTLSASHRTLFGHTARGAVPPYETEYGVEGLFQQPQEMGDLMGFYNAFGLAVNVQQHERPDHVSCECEFLSFLALKEAYALEHEDTAMLEETRKAERLFLHDHLARFLPAFANKLVHATNPHPYPLPLGEGEGKGDFHGFYRALAELGLKFIAAECVRFGMPAGPENLTLRPADDDRVPMACGSGTECAAMPGACMPEEADSV
ncbi:MAG: molecular chaperone TorD family protein [Deltaproteobacteria bacterium]|nr:molecular chaperone TorD family protein [Deltaproteobacteria bacterium]